MADEKAYVPSKEQVIFIKRERVRRELMKIRPGETICLDSEKVEIILKWIKQLEQRGKF